MRQEALRRAIFCRTPEDGPVTATQQQEFERLNDEQQAERRKIYGAARLPDVPNFAEHAPTRAVFRTIVVNAGQASFRIDEQGDDESKEVGGGASNAEEEEEEDAVEAPDQLKPPSYDTYWEQVRKRININRVKTPYSCEIHTRAPIARDEMAQLVKERAADTAPKQGSYARAMADTAMQKLRWEIWDIERHERQYKTQRGYIQHREEMLPHRTPTCLELIVYEDFVSQYDLNGKKVHNLVFTIVWRNAEGLLQRKYLDNYCTDKGNKCDTSMVCDVWKFHLRPNELRHLLKDEGKAREHRETLQAELDHLLLLNPEPEFWHATAILRTGDSGGHFHSIKNLLFESGVFARYAHNVAHMRSLMHKRHTHPTQGPAFGLKRTRCARDTLTRCVIPMVAASRGMRSRLP
jgi:hypothetical protein